MVMDFLNFPTLENSNVFILLVQNSIQISNLRSEKKVQMDNPIVRLSAKNVAAMLQRRLY